MRSSSRILAILAALGALGALGMAVLPPGEAQAASSAEVTPLDVCAMITK